MNSAPKTPPSAPAGPFDIQYPLYFGIDPGNAHTAYCLLEGNGKILSFGKRTNEDFATQIQTFLSLHEGRDTRVACEMISSYGMAVGASVFETCLFIGRLQELVGVSRLVLIPRLEVKLEICKSPKANDSNIRAALIDRFGPPGSMKCPGATYGISKDCWAALGLAETLRSGRYRPYVPTQDRV